MLSRGLIGVAPDADEKLTAKFKLSYTGTPAGVLKGGYMLKHLPEITVQAVPNKMPQSVTADVSALNIGDTFRVKDLKLNEGVTILTDENASLVSITPARRARGEKYAAVSCGAAVFVLKYRLHETR